MEYANKKNISFTASEDLMMNLDVYSNNVNTLYTLRCTLAVIILLSLMMIMQGFANICATSTHLANAPIKSDKSKKASKRVNNK